MGVFVVLMAGILSYGPDSSDLEKKMARLVNVEREVRGLPRLELVPLLSDAARKHSQTMADLEKISHEADGRLMEERIQSVIKDACLFGENITKHYTIEYALSDLMGSPGHRANLLEPDFTGIGIGIVEGKGGLLYITQDFFSRCKESKKAK